jgi:hypothetical protein
MISGYDDPAKVSWAIAVGARTFPGEPVNFQRLKQEPGPIVGQREARGG